ncbi:hypothetical protein NLI96_g3084 [Meripilus lineatus]|uniref:HAD hydrolase subfamily IA REG-2-like protein n=1 Tax=Meripilus lineatus TaxID=2056292 RepID=A0AAD5V7L0_9APHY|nr:hypothetical protein NLI96_g3084 [Physisporinus lineatus]
MTIRLVTFDALHTIVTPRLPVYVQYAQTFEPYLGVLEPEALKKSFKLALNQVQSEKPVYQSGHTDWWGEVIKRTAIGAGADPRAVDASLSLIVPKLLHRFSSKEGYKLFDDTLPCLQELKRLNIRTGLVSNTDSRMKLVLEDLGILPLLDPILLSETEGVEKPSREIYFRACSKAQVSPDEVVHVGDELVADYKGATEAGLTALLVRRPAPEGDEERKDPDEDLNGVEVVSCLQQVVQRISKG